MRREGDERIEPLPRLYAYGILLSAQFINSKVHSGRNINSPNVIVNLDNDPTNYYSKTFSLFPLKIITQSYYKTQLTFTHSITLSVWSLQKDIFQFRHGYKMICFINILTNMKTFFCLPLSNVSLLTTLKYPVQHHNVISIHTHTASTV